MMLGALFLLSGHLLLSIVVHALIDARILSILSNHNASDELERD